MPPKKKPVQEPPFWRNVVGPIPLVVLLFGLGLSAANLAFMTLHTSKVVSLWMSNDLLRENFRLGRSTGQARGAAAELQEEILRRSSPGARVIYSVVSYRDGEWDMLQERLVDPLVDYYRDAAYVPPLEVVLIERKNQGSRDVNVRLFFEDGTEETYLWPRTRSADGWWLPPCTVGATAGPLPGCPPVWLGTYPQIAALLSERAP